MRLEIHTVLLSGPSGQGNGQKNPSAATGFELA